MINFTCQVRIARNTFYNLLGHAVPMVAAILVIPILVNVLGTSRFGILHFAWMVVGCFTLFDLGIGKATSKFVAKKIGAKQFEDIPVLIWTSQFILLLLGVLISVLMIIMVPWLDYNVLKIPDSIKQEALVVFYMLSVAIPIVINTAGLRGILEGQQRFDITSSLRIGAGLFSYLGPFLALTVSQNLIVIVAVLFVGRLVGFIIHFVFCIKVTPMVTQRVSIEQKTIWSMLYFGSWMVMTNLVHLIVSYTDRFLIGAVVSLAAVAYYATPYEMVVNLFIIPGSIIKVLFPAFVTTVVQNKGCTEKLFDRGMKFIFMSIFPMVLAIAIFAREGLDVWLGSEFAQYSTTVMQVISLGVYISSMTQPSFALIQSVGRPDLTAKLAIVVLPFYVSILWKLVSIYGIQGAAFVWTGKQILDSVFLLVLVRQFIPNHFSIFKHAILPFAPILSIILSAYAISALIYKMIFFVVTLSIVICSFWMLVLNGEEKNQFKSLLKSILPFYSSDKLVDG